MSQRTRKPRHENLPPATIVGSGVAVIAILAVLGFLAVRSPNGLPLVNYRILHASVPNAGNLQPHSEVRVRGVRVGQVVGIRADHGRGLIDIKLNPGSGQLSPDTTARVRGAGLLGQRYVELIPGTAAGNLSDGATIQGRPDALANGIPEVLLTFDQRTRFALRSVVDEVGKGVDGRGAGINRGLRAAPPSGKAFSKVADAAFERPGALRRLVPSLASGTAALDGARDSIVEMFRPAADGLQPFVDEAPAVRRSLDELPTTLETARPGLAEGRKLIGAARDLVEAVRDELPPAPGALRATTALLRESREPLARTTRLLRSARTAVPHLLRITDAASPVLSPLRRTLMDANPVLRQLGLYGCDIDNFTENWRSTLGYGVPGSGQDTPLPSGLIGGLGLFRITVLAGTESVQRVSRPAGSKGPDPYPRPCAASPGPKYVEPQIVPGG